MIILHPHYVEARASLLRALDAALPGELIFVVGLSGIGKSELRKQVMNSFCGDPKSWGKGRIPAISVRATPSDKSFFNPKDFMLRLAVAVNEPQIGWLDRSGTPMLMNPDEKIANEDPIWNSLKQSRTPPTLLFQAHFKIHRLVTNVFHLYGIAFLTRMAILPPRRIIFNNISQGIDWAKSKKQNQ